MTTSASSPPSNRGRTALTRARASGVPSSSVIRPAIVPATGSATSAPVACWPAASSSSTGAPVAGCPYSVVTKPVLITEMAKRPAGSWVTRYWPSASVKVTRASASAGEVTSTRARAMGAPPAALVTRPAIAPVGGTAGAGGAGLAAACGGARSVDGLAGGGFAAHAAAQIVNATPRRIQVWRAERMWISYD